MTYCALVQKGKHLTLAFGCVVDRCWFFCQLVCSLYWQALSSKVLQRCFNKDHESCSSPSKGKPRKEDTVKCRWVFCVGYSYIGDLYWAQPVQNWQGDRRSFIPLDFPGDALVADKTRRLQLPLLLPARRICRPLCTGRMEARRTKYLCQKQFNRDIDSLFCGLRRRVYFLLLLLRPVWSCKKRNIWLKGILGDLESKVGTVRSGQIDQKWPQKLSVFHFIILASKT